MERRQNLRIPTRLPLEVVAGRRRWSGDLVNRSAEGALLRLRGEWDEGARDVNLVVAVDDQWQGFSPKARVVRASVPDNGYSLVAVRF